MNSSKIMALAIVGIMIASGFSFFSSSFGNSSNITPIVKAQIQTTVPSGTSTTAYAYQENFSSALDSHWAIWGEPPYTFKISNGELAVSPQYSWGICAYRYFNLSKQDFVVSFNFQTASNTTVSGEPVVFMLMAQGMYLNAMIVGEWGIGLAFEHNYTLKIKHDDGTLNMTPNYAYSYSPKLGNATNYQISMAFNRITDSVWLRILNKTSGVYLLDDEYTTFQSGIKSNMPIPDRFDIGDPELTAGHYFYWLYDNFTISYTQAVSGVVPLDTAAIESAINAHAAVLQAAEISPTNFSTAWAVQWNVSWLIVPYNVSGSRDDVAGDMIGSLSMLYQYTGDQSYLDEAKALWAVLETHQQPDGGFTFATNASDYSDTDARIILGLLELYEVSHDATYLSAANSIGPILMTYQTMVLGNPYSAPYAFPGQVYANMGRPSWYGLPNIPYFTAYFAVAMLRLYEFTGNGLYLTRAIMALGNLLNSTEENGAIWGFGYGFLSIYGYADYNDVVNAGSTLWALSEGYKTTHNSAYLTTAEKVAAYLIRSQFTKDGKSWGIWSGVVKERFNQMDTVYNYMIEYGLQSYLDIVPSDLLAQNAFTASLNFYANIIGVSDCIQGTTLYGMTGRWAGAYCFNDSNRPEITWGWWDELGGWSTTGMWGLVAFNGWQGNVIKIMLNLAIHNGWKYLWGNPDIPSNIRGLIQLTYFFFGLGVVVAPIVWTVKLSKAQKKLNVHDIFQMFVYIIIGLAGVGVLWTLS